MEEYNDNGAVDGFLKSVGGIKPVDPGPFFYTKLRARMQDRFEAMHSFRIPTWVIGMLFVFLALNSWMIIQQTNTVQQNVEKKSSTQVFAEAYNLNSNSNY